MLETKCGHSNLNMPHATNRKLPRDVCKPASAGDAIDNDSEIDLHVAYSIVLGTFT